MTTPQSTTEQIQEEIRSRYIPLLAPLFYPDPPNKWDIVQYFASLLRVLGMEDKGWDPYAESRGVLDDLNALMQLDLPGEKFENKELTAWRLGLLFYSHIVEMSAPYEVLANLLRYQLGKGYSPNPYFDFLTKDEQKRFRKSGLSPKQKISVIKKLAKEADSNVGDIFDEFHHADFRNAIAHSDFIFADEGFRCRGNSLSGSFRLSYEEVNGLITKARVFIGTYFGLERDVRRTWGEYAEKPMAYDPVYKGVMEILVDSDGLMNGFKVHWPNNHESTYRRSDSGIDMTNCMFTNNNLDFFVGLYARKPGSFSPLVEYDAAPVYTPTERGAPIVWAP